MLINCSTCRKMISNYRNYCPHCYCKIGVDKKSSIWWRFSFDRFKKSSSTEKVTKWNVKKVKSKKK